jgi:F420-non-reducing hydrogenase small subunit
MDARPKIALYWCAGCGGCEESVIDMAHELLVLTKRAQIVFWPIALDYRKADLERCGDGELLVSLINGAVRTDEQEDMARLLRRKSKLVMAHGACAHIGGVVGLGNFFSTEALLARAFREVPTVDNPQGPLPGQEDEDGLPPLAKINTAVRPLGDVIDVDYALPGCPPTPQMVAEAIFGALDDRLPPAGSVLAADETLCDSCPRRDSRPAPQQLDGFKRLQTTRWDAERCFLAQQLVCLGPVTRGGCENRCLAANMPCRGCFGPAPGVRDQGARAMAFLAALVRGVSQTNDAEGRFGIPDPAGLFYRYSLAASVLKRRFGGSSS